jgi:hypothetical protein
MLLSLSISFASIVWLCILSTRFSRHERLTILSASLYCIGPIGFSSSSISPRNMS